MSQKIRIHEIFCRWNIFDDKPNDVLVKLDWCSTNFYCKNVSDDHLLTVSQDVYRNMSDTFRLCSLWLQLSIPFYCKILFADIVLDPIDEMPVFDPSYKLTQENMDSCQAILDSLAHGIKFFLQPTCPFPCFETMGLEAYTTTDPIVQLTDIVVMQNFRKYHSDPYYRGMSTRSRQALQICFATVLLHEITHAVFGRSFSVAKPEEIADGTYQWVNEPKFA